MLVADLEGLRDMAEVCGVPTVPPADAAAWATSVLAAIDEPDRARPSRPVRDWSVVAGEYARVFAGLTSVDYSGSGGSTPSGRSTANTLSVIETSP